MILATISLVISILGGTPYAIQAIRGKIKPERATWGIWTVILILSLAGYRAEGGQESSLFILGDLIITASIFLVAIFKGSGGASRLDRICIALSLVGLLVWEVSSDPVYQIIGTVSADALALVPTIKKTLDYPESESPLAFFSASLAALLGLISVGHWNLVLIMYPVYLYSVNLITAVVIISAQYVNKKKVGINQ